MQDLYHQPYDYTNEPCGIHIGNYFAFHGNMASKTPSLAITKNWSSLLIWTSGVQDLRGLGFRVQGLGFRVYDLAQT